MGNQLTDDGFQKLTPRLRVADVTDIGEIGSVHLETGGRMDPRDIDHASAARPSSASLRTVFQFRAVFVTPIHLSKRSASLLFPKP